MYALGIVGHNKRKGSVRTKFESTGAFKTNKVLSRLKFLYYLILFHYINITDSGFLSVLITQ